MGGWPEAVSLVILGAKRHAEARARYQASLKKVGRVAAPAVALREGRVPNALSFDLEKIRLELSGNLRRAASDDDLYSYLMYPTVFTDFARHLQAYSDVSVLPTPAFFYGLRPGEEISVAIEEGKTLIVRLVSVGPPDKDGRRALSYELNGIAREASIPDQKVAPKARAPAQGRPGRPHAGRRAHSGPDRRAGRLGRHQGGQGRQAADDGGDEDAEHRLRPLRRRGRRAAGGPGRHGGEQGLAGEDPAGVSGTIRSLAAKRRKQRKDCPSTTPLRLQLDCL
jgi:hypothetical protein